MTTIWSLAARQLSIFHSPRTPHRALPRLVDARAARPCCSRIWPPVGKSGPLMCLSRSLVVELRVVDQRDRRRRITSPRLCGGMLVAMPTAMPVQPLTSRCGTVAGSTIGSSRRAVVVRRGSRPSRCSSLAQQLVATAAPAAPRCSARPPARRRRASRSCRGRRPAARASRTAAPCAPSRRSTAVSPCGWYLPSTSPTTVAHFRGFASAARPRFWAIA